MSYLLIAYPDLAVDDYNKIQEYRKINDPLFFNVVDPHFTFVFPVFDMGEASFISEVKDKSKEFTKVDFTICCATITKDSFSDYYYLLLVPDEGYSRIVKMHDKLYSDKLKDNLRLDIDFTPHMGIADSLDKYECKKMVDEWNANNFFNKWNYFTVGNCEL
jgi:hypothetical protein